MELNPLVVIWYSAAIVGALAVVVAVVVRRRRQAALFVAAALFGVCGVLGILSIGLLFLVAGVACGIAAARTSTAPG